jgi:inner membrane protein
LRWISHVAIATLFIKLVEISLLIDLSSYYLWPVIALYAVMPDFDSIVGIKHRTYTHTLYAPFIATIPLLFSPPAFIAALTAYLSHIFADLLTPAGLPLLYPKPTVYHLLPAAWRIKTGSGGELILLAVVLLLSASFTMAASTTEMDKIFYYHRNHDIWVDISFYENGVLKTFNEEKVVWTNSKSRIGIVEGKRLKIIGKDQIISIKIVRMESVERYEREIRTTMKRLQTMDGLITAYSTNYVWRDFLGTGRDLFLNLFDGNWKKKIEVRVIASTN